MKDEEEQWKYTIYIWNVHIDDLLVKL